MPDVKSPDHIAVADMAQALVRARTEVVKVVLMTEGEFARMKGRSWPDAQPDGQHGCMVMYSDGHMLWSPKDAFKMELEEANRKKELSHA